MAKMSTYPAASRSLRAAAACVVALLVVSACGGPAVERPGAGADRGRDLVDEGPPVAGGKLVVAVTGETDGWHPTANNWAIDGHLVGSAIFDPLLRFEPDGDVAPYLAESVTSNEDFTDWMVTVRDGVRFHDGTVLDAAAVKQNLDVALFEGLPSLVLEGIVEDVTVEGPRTVAIHLNRPIAHVDVALAGVGGYMAAPSMLDDPDGAEHPIGTGPFEFDSWVRDSEIVVRRWDDYWRRDEAGNRLPYLDEIEFRVIVDDSARRQALAAGDVDLILTTGADDIAAARSDDAVVSVEDNRSEETHVMLNTAIAPFDNRHAREALAYGTDVESLIDVTQAGLALPATSPWAPGTPWAVADADYPDYDPERARQAVADYEADTGEPLSFRFAGLPLNNGLEVQQFLAQEWGDLGIDVHIDTLEQTAYLLQTIQGDYQAAWFRNFTFTDPVTLAVFFHSRYVTEPPEISTNFTRISNPDIDAALELGTESDDPAVRHDAYAEVARELNHELSHIWLFHTPFALIADPSVHGLNPPRELGFASTEPKPWIGGLWVTDQP